MSIYGLEGWLVGRTPEELRSCYVEWRLKPLARLLFRDAPAARSLTVAFSQYWSDEADDAVHETFAVSEERNPPWLNAPQAFHDEETMRRSRLVHDVLQSHGLPVDCDDDASLVIAFASCCAEGSLEHFHYPPPTPWAIARREDDSAHPSIEVIGRVWRPEWEDRWVVGYQRSHMRTLALDVRLARHADRRARLLEAVPSPRRLLV